MKEKGSEYTHTAAGVDPHLLDQPLESEKSGTGALAFSSKTCDWSRYYEERDPGMSTDILDTDEAKQTTSLNLQQASVMVAEGSDETPLISATQTTATVADLDIEGLNPEEPTVSNGGSNVSMSTSVGRTMSSPEKTQIVSGVSASSSGSGYLVSSTPAGMIDPREVFSTAPSVVTGPYSVASVVPYDRGPRIIPPYNNSVMHEDSTFSVYVDYIGNIMPILDRQSIATSWPPTPHPLTGQIRYVAFNRGNMPTVPYMMNVGSSL